MKIVLEYDPVSGAITENSGAYIAAWMGLDSHELKKQEKAKAGVDDLIRLKAAGFSAEEIMNLQARGVI